MTGTSFYLIRFFINSSVVLVREDIGPYGCIVKWLTEDKGKFFMFSVGLIISCSSDACSNHAATAVLVNFIVKPEKPFHKDI